MRENHQSVDSHKGLERATKHVENITTSQSLLPAAPPAESMLKMLSSLRVMHDLHSSKPHSVFSSKSSLSRSPHARNIIPDDAFDASFKSAETSSVKESYQQEQLQASPEGPSSSLNGRSCALPSGFAASGTGPVDSLFGSSAKSLYTTSKTHLQTQGCPSSARVESCFAACGAHSEYGAMLQWFAQSLVALFTEGLEAVAIFPEQWEAKLQAQSSSLRPHLFELQGFSTLFAFVWGQLASVECYAMGLMQSGGSSNSRVATVRSPDDILMAVAAAMGNGMAENNSIAFLPYLPVSVENSAVLGGSPFCPGGGSTTMRPHGLSVSRREGLSSRYSSGFFHSHHAPGSDHDKPNSHGNSYGSGLLSKKSSMYRDAPKARRGTMPFIGKKEKRSSMLSSTLLTSQKLCFPNVASTGNGSVRSGGDSVVVQRAHSATTSPPLSRTASPSRTGIEDVGRATDIHCSTKIHESLTQTQPISGKGTTPPRGRFAGPLLKVRTRGRDGIDGPVADAKQLQVVSDNIAGCAGSSPSSHGVVHNDEANSTGRQAVGKSSPGITATATERRSSTQATTTTAPKRLAVHSHALTRSTGGGNTRLFGGNSVDEFGNLTSLVPPQGLQPGIMSSNVAVVPAMTMAQGQVEKDAGGVCSSSMSASPPLTFVEMQERDRERRLKKELGVRHVQNFAKERDMHDYVKYLDEIRASAEEDARVDGNETLL